MTKEEFVSRQADAERRIRRLVSPLGIIYSIRLAVAGYGLYLLIPLFQYFNTEARAVILYELGACILVFAASFPWERYSKRRFVELAIKCPSCQSILVFLREEKTNETGICYNCGRKVFEE